MNNIIIDGIDEVKIKCAYITCWNCKGYHEFERLAGCGWSSTYQCPNCKIKINLKSAYDEDWGIICELIKLVRGNKSVSTNTLRSILNHYEDEFERIWEHEDRIKSLK